MTTGLILAAGQGKRFGSEIPKQFHSLRGKPIIQYSLETFDSIDSVTSFGIMTVGQHEKKIRDLLNQINCNKCNFIKPGGEKRRDSVRIGLNDLRELEPETVLIHDAARPGVSRELIQGLLSQYRNKNNNFQGIIPVLPVNDTIKSVTSEVPKKVKTTLDRSELRKVQTPQLFNFSLLHKIHQNWDSSQKVTDDSMMLESNDYEIGIITGSNLNRKVTYPVDLKILEDLFEDQS